MPSLPRNLFAAIAFFALAAAGSGQVGDGQDLGDVRVQGDRKVTDVVLRSSSPETLRLMQTGFTVNGAFELRESLRNASFAIGIEPVGSAGARLTISSGAPEVVKYTETVAGSSLREATLRAMDRAVYKTTGLNGFFSGRLAFVGGNPAGGEIYVSDIFFGGLTKLTSDSAEAVRPRWSPDGNYIVFTSYKSGFPDIYRIDLRTNRRDVVASFKGTNLGARYSPDGSRMTMVLTGGANADVFIREVSGSLRNLTRSRGLESAPCWSPDGRQLVFSSDQSGGPQLYTMPAEGGTMRRLATDISGYCAEPDWSVANPNLIAFTAAQSGGYQIAVYDIAAGKSRWITSERGDGIEPNWLNDGRHILYTHRRANNRELKIVDTETRDTYTISGQRDNFSQATFLAPR